MGSWRHVCLNRESPRALVSTWIDLRGRTKQSMPTLAEVRERLVGFGHAVHLRRALLHRATGPSAPSSKVRGQAQRHRLLAALARRDPLSQRIASAMRRTGRTHRHLVVRAADAADLTSTIGRDVVQRDRRPRADPCRTSCRPGRGRRRRCVRRPTSCRTPSRRSFRTLRSTLPNFPGRAGSARDSGDGHFHFPSRFLAAGRRPAH